MSFYFELRSLGKILATVSARPVGITGERPLWAWEIRYANKPAHRGTVGVPPQTDELEIVSLILQDYLLNVDGSVAS